MNFNLTERDFEYYDTIPNVLEKRRLRLYNLNSMLWMKGLDKTVNRYVYFRQFLIEKTNQLNHQR